MFTEEFGKQRFEVSGRLSRSATPADDQKNRWNALVYAY